MFKKHYRVYLTDGREVNIQADKFVRRHYPEEQLFIFLDMTGVMPWDHGYVIAAFVCIDVREIHEVVVSENRGELTKVSRM